ncbi:alpha/beta hydrolase family protein [Parahaliea mediterranea]|uniref:PET hydrolase/cutinase-like domain-containing protein n=1 Tax=Parahaliea mediterranea TaxID=651086 RepID=A0A939DDY7_9GAMM|nr:CocE/NonD family hydrolase [Parahaliea mediterranea]MBN7796416.1 hypothetical protein [Parahaliea mediterranea]
MKILLNLLLVLLLVSVAAIGALVFGWQPEPFPPHSASNARLQPGPLSVAHYDTVFEDRSRATSANKDYPGADSRRLEATVWHPAVTDAGPHPLLVYSHGYSSNRRGGAYLAEYMASLGYVVAAIDFPLTNMYAPGGPWVRDVVNQPADVRFVIDRILQDAATPDHPLAGLVDPGRIGVFGLSLGGLTTELVAFHPEMRDPRVGAALSIAGPTSMLAPAFFRQRAGLPFLMLAGDIDALVPWDSNAAPIPGKLPGAELVTVRGASHTGFAGPAAWMRWMDNPDALGCYIVTRNIGEDMDEPWFELIGSPEQGVIADGENELCRVDPLPEAMNVLRQQMITRVVVGSFFDHHFALSGERRAAARAYLREQMAAELPEVEYAVSPPRVAGASAQ